MAQEVMVNEDAITKKVLNVFNSVLTPDAQLEIATLFAKMCNPYVPFLEGPLSQTVEIHPTYLRYIQPYAHYQYTGTGFNHTLDYHPRATAYWDKVMMEEKGDEFLYQVRDILVRRAKELYG